MVIKTKKVQRQEARDYELQAWAAQDQEAAQRRALREEKRDKEDKVRREKQAKKDRVRREKQAAREWEAAQQKALRDAKRKVQLEARAAEWAAKQVDWAPILAAKAAKVAAAIAERQAKREIRAAKKAESQALRAANPNSLGPHRAPFAPEKCEEIGKKYDAGASVQKIAGEYAVSRYFITASIVSTGRKLRLANGGKFTPEVCEEAGKDYDAGMGFKSLAKKYNCGLTQIKNVILKTGRTLRQDLRSRHQKKPQRLKSIWAQYRLILKDMWHLMILQKGLCLWCKEPLNPDPLRNIVDHIGGSQTFKDRTKVRGLCCFDGLCNRFAGFVENKIGIDKNQGLLAPYVGNIKHIVEHNQGNIAFPEWVSVNKPPIISEMDRLFA